LPVNTYPISSITVAILVLVGYVAARYGVATYSDTAEQKRFFIAASGFLFTLSLIAARASSGELLSSNLSSVGPQWWLMPILVTLEFAVGIGVCLAIPKIKKSINEARNAKQKNL